MNLILDTHLLLWSAGQVENLSKKARSFITNPENELWFSVASIWEVAIKSMRVKMPLTARELRAVLILNDYKELTITSEHAVAIDLMPTIHADPFDRIIVAQAHIEGFTLLTADAELAKYPGQIQKV